MAPEKAQELLKRMTFEVVNGEMDRGLASEVGTFIRAQAAEISHEREARAETEAAMRAFIADFDKVTAENARLRVALHFYADFYENPNDGPWGTKSHDFGATAIDALTAYKEAGE